MSQAASNRLTSKTTATLSSIRLLPDEDFEEAVRIAQAEYDQHQPDVVVGSTRGGAVAMNIDSGDTPLVLLCPAWKNWGNATTVKPQTTILHSKADDVIPFEDSEELLRNSGLPASALIEIGNDHRLADPEPLAKMLEACETHQQLVLMFSFYEGLKQKGPGSEASTLKALAMLGELRPKPSIVDFGCGAGAASITLAKATDGSITAIDIHKKYLEEVEALAKQEGLADRIQTVQTDMADPPIPDGSVDMVWSEGAVYNIGFEHGLKRWRRLLRPGGCITVTELTWLAEAPPQKAVDFWQSEYPDISGVEDNLARVRAAGFEVVDHFALPSKDWQSFYGPLEKQIATLREKHAGNATALAMLDSLQQEVDLWKECGDSYGYVFYLGKAS